MVKLPHSAKINLLALRMCDASYDKVDNKTFALLVRVFDEKVCAVRSRFLDMPICNVGTVEKLFCAI